MSLFEATGFSPTGLIYPDLLERSDTTTAKGKNTKFLTYNISHL
jgi:hypothetical protein